MNKDEEKAMKEVSSKYIDVCCYRKFTDNFEAGWIACSEWKEQQLLDLINTNKAKMLEAFPRLHLLNKDAEAKT